jgi:hypothetical protein
VGDILVSVGGMGDGVLAVPGGRLGTGDRVWDILVSVGGMGARVLAAVAGCLSVQAWPLGARIAHPRRIWRTCFVSMLEVLSKRRDPHFQYTEIEVAMQIGCYEAFRVVFPVVDGCN